MVQWATVIVQNLILKRRSGAAYVQLRGNAALIELNLSSPLEMRPGQFVYIWLPSAGFWSIFQSHPYMISWQTGTTLSALLQPQRGFSRRIKHLAEDPSPSLAWVDGPFGNPPDFSEYDTVILVADGIGITSHLLVMKDLLQKYRGRTARVKEIILFWRIDNEGAIYDTTGSPIADGCP